MSPFYIVLATVVIRLVNIEYGKATLPYIVSIYNKHTGTPKGYQICAGSLVTHSYVLTTRFCLPRHAYKIRYGDMKSVDNPTYSQILHKKYHPNSRPESILSKRMNIKQVVTGSNNIAMALIQKIPDQQFGLLAAIDYRSVVGRQVTYCAFDVSETKDLLRSNKKQSKKEQLDLKAIFKRKKKILREYFIKMNANKTKMLSGYHIRHQLTKNDISHAIHNVIKYTSGVVAPCEDKMSMGPIMCVVEKCMATNTQSNKQLIRTPDFGTPLIYDGKIVGIAADVDEHFIKFTPVSPFLNWINDYVKLDTSKVESIRLNTKHSGLKRFVLKDVTLPQKRKRYHRFTLKNLRNLTVSHSPFIDIQSF